MTAHPAGLDADDLAELTPLLRRVAALDPAGLVRLRAAGKHLTALAVLPFDVLVGRRVPTTRGVEASWDQVHVVGELLDWVDGGSVTPNVHDERWRSGTPPVEGWHRVETVPDEVLRGLVRQGAATLREAAEREGVAGAQPRAEVADALLNSTVLTVSAPGLAAGVPVEISLRLVSALIRMGFVARGSAVAVDVSGRWLRLAASYGSVYAERQGLGLGVVTRAAQR